MSFFLDLANNKTSVLVQSQVPEFIRNNYPLFVQFIEAYYEYLEQNGKLVNVAKNIPNYLDVDYVVENDVTDFIEIFREMYLTNIPTNILADKAKLLKHIKTFYSSRGTTKSFKFLFRALFNEDVSTFNTGDQILRASDGKWYQPQTIRITTSNAASLWVNTQIFGQLSYASAVVETSVINNLSGVSYLELTLSNVTKTFLPSETIYANTSTDQFLIGSVLGIVPGITVVTPGAKYNVGDPALVVGGGGANATAEVSMVSDGSITDFSVLFGGSGFSPSYVSGGNPYQPTWNIATTSNVRSSSKRYYCCG